MLLPFPFLLPQGPGTSEDLKNKKMVTAEKSYLQRRNAAAPNEDWTRWVKEGIAARQDRSQPLSLKPGETSKA